MAAKASSCRICQDECDYYDNSALQCENCKETIHVRCLDQGSLPTFLLGDVFYNLFCEKCSDEGEQVFFRQKMPWLTCVLLTLYNLKLKSEGISKMGYFHWKSDISSFINNNWEHFFGRMVKRKKNWIGTISGTLSHFSGIFFQSGTNELGEQGYWKLIGNEPPEVLVIRNQKELEMKKKNQAKLKGKLDSTEYSKSSYVENSATGIVEAETADSSISKNIDKGKESMIDDLKDFLDLDIEAPNLEVDFPSFIESCSGVEEVTFKTCGSLPNDFISDTFQKEPKIKTENLSEELMVSSEPLKKMSQLLQDCPRTENSSEKNISEQIEISENENNLPTPPPSMLKQKNTRDWPWDETFKLNPEDIRPLMSEREEEFLLQKIEQNKYLLSSAPLSVKRLYRKLVVRKLKRQHGLPILDVDTFGQNRPLAFQIMKKGNTVLDRFISEDLNVYFEQRLQGNTEPTSVHSPYTNRLLKPYIRRDTTTNPLWIKVTRELLAKVNANNPLWRPTPIAPIDYSYIRPQHIPAINSLCNQYFWPGVNLTECLQYPDFTCIVLYKKLVVGFAIMVPDVGYNEAYISFLLVRPEWRNAGIGTFMLYHLIQTCMGKDITLHVSASNPALLLYQKFGFKQEEFIQDFYEKYIPPSVKESKHAFFLRLSR